MFRSGWQWAKQKPHKKCGAVTKTQNIDMILAFFNVVASRQISPHILFRAAKIDIFFDMQIFFKMLIVKYLLRCIKNIFKISYHR